MNEEEELLSEAKLYNLTGELLKSNSFIGKTTSINIQNLPSATYLLELSSDKKRVVKKFIKTN